MAKSKAVEATPKPRVVIYARVSTDDPQQAGSCDTQIARCEQYCEVMGYLVIARTKDEGISAKTMDRPGWRKIEAMLRDGLADVVISTALDRMTRTVEGFLRFVREVIEPHGKSFVTIQEKFDTTSAAGKLLFHMLLVLAQFQREQTGEKVSAARLTKAKQGLMMTKPPFGTIPGPQRGIPVKDPERWPYVELMFSMAAQGKPANEILARLADEHVRTTNGAMVNHSTLVRLLKSRFYLGEISANDQWYEGKHDCRIDPKIWKAAQKLGNGKRGPAPKDYFYLLDGLLVSSHFRITYPEGQAGKPCPLHTRYFKNRLQKHYFMYARADKLRKYGGIQVEPADAIKAPNYYRADQLEKTIMDWLLSPQNMKKMHVEVEDSLREVHSRKSKAYQMREKLQQQLKTAEVKLKKLKQQVIDAVLTDKKAVIDTINEEMEQTQDTISDLTTKLGDLGAAEHRLKEAATDASEVVGHIELLRSAWDAGDREKVRQLLRVLIEQIDVRADGIKVRLYALPYTRVYEYEDLAPPPGIEPGSTA